MAMPRISCNLWMAPVEPVPTHTTLPSGPALTWRLMAASAWCSSAVADRPVTLSSVWLLA